MLRVFVFEEPYAVKFRLEGSLTADTTPLLTQRWADLRNGLMSRKLVIDMGDVRDVDHAGHDTLKWLAESGATFVAVGAHLRMTLKDVICSEADSPAPFNHGIRRAFHWLGCDRRVTLPRSRACRLLCALVPTRFRPCDCQTT
jgi:hypothetical protein